MQDAVSIDGEKIIDIGYVLEKSDKERILRIGRKIFRIVM